MRYWVYINNKVDGPYDETKLVTLSGFSQSTLICSEEVASKGGQEWVKADSVFEFDEVPVQNETPVLTQQTSAVSSNSGENTEALLAKLDSLTEEISSLHSKLDSMQTHLDEALEQNKQLAQQAALQQVVSVPPGETSENTATPSVQSPVSDDISNNTQEEPSDVNQLSEDPFPAQAAPKEEELIIRSALDSIYGEKAMKQPQFEETFQELLPQKEAEAVEKIGEELTFTPIDEGSKNEDSKEEAPLKEALITTPSADEAERDALISELTSSPKEDILDQIIAERQENKEEPILDKSKEEEDKILSSVAANKTDSELDIAVGGAALAGIASAAALTVSQEEEQPEVDVKEEEQPTPETKQISLDEEKSASEQEEQATAPQESFTLATDKNDPTHMEEVLPADQLPSDVVSQDAAKQDEQPQTSSLDSIASLQEPSTSSTEDAQPLEPAPEEEMQELVPGAALDEKKEEPDGIYEKDPVSTSEPVLSDKDLEEALQLQESIQSETAVEVPENNNPYDLTEIELKEGSTYLISDFVPPAQVTDDPAAVMASTLKQQPLNKKQEAIIQDMLAVSNKSEQTQTLPTEGLPNDTTANKVSLENTIQAKRGASLDIKTVPMVPEPADAQRLDVNELDDVNAQHDIKTAKSNSNLTRIVILSLVGLLLLIVLYVLLGLVNMLPNSINIFAPKSQPVVEQTTEEFLQEESLPTNEQQMGLAVNTELEPILQKVMDFPLPNSRTLKQFIEEKHPLISPDLITWEIGDSVEPDNYSITVKVPPENPQNFKTVYRFNYNVQSGLLEPTVSEAKNLLDQAYAFERK